MRAEALTLHLAVFESTKSQDGNAVSKNWQNFSVQGKDILIQKTLQSKFVSIVCQM